MTSKRGKDKRAKVAIEPAPAPASLVAELFDVFLEAGRKERQQLLSVLLKASSAAVLKLVRDEAVKIGAYVQTKPSRFQTCNHAMLDSFLSFLAPADLELAATICRRWNSACVNSNAGWIAALSRAAVADKLWMKRVWTRQINPVMLRNTALAIADDVPLATMFGRIASLTSVTMPNSSPTVTGLGILSQLPLRALNIGYRLNDIAVADAMVAAPFARSLESLSLSNADTAQAFTLLQLPKLQSLTISVYDPQRLTSKFILTSTSLTSLQFSAFDIRRSLERVDIDILACVKLPQLRTLVLPIQHLSQSECGMIGSLKTLTYLSLHASFWSRESNDRLQQLTALRSLERLHIGCVEDLNPLIVLKELSSLRLRAMGLPDEQNWAATAERIKDFFLPVHSLPKLQLLHINRLFLMPNLLCALPPTLRTLALEGPFETKELKAYVPSEELLDYLPELKAIAFNRSMSVEQFTADAQAIRPSLVVHPAWEPVMGAWQD